MTPKEKVDALIEELLAKHFHIDWSARTTDSLPSDECSIVFNALRQFAVDVFQEWRQK